VDVGGCMVGGVGEGRGGGLVDVGTMGEPNTYRRPIHLLNKLV